MYVTLRADQKHMFLITPFLDIVTTMETYCPQNWNTYVNLDIEYFYYQTDTIFASRPSFFRKHLPYEIIYWSVRRVIDIHTFTGL